MQLAQILTNSRKSSKESRKLLRNKDLRLTSDDLLLTTNFFNTYLDLMKNIILTLTFTMLFAAAFAQKTVTQNFTPAGNDAIEVGIKNNNYTTTQGKIAKFLVQVEIKVNYPKEVIDQLILAGRYKVTTAITNKNFQLTAANLDKAVTVGGKALTEDIRINVSVPPLYTIAGTKITKAATMKSIAEPLEVVITFVYPPVTSGSTIGSTGSELSTPTSNTLKDVQAKFGDIIMGGMAIDFTR